MPAKPANLLYGVDDRPPLQIILILAFQHLLFMSGGFIIVSMVMHTVGAPPAQISHIVSMSMIAAGIGTILQALKKGPVGSGYLCAEGTDPSFMAVSILAAQTGGLSLVFGMTIVVGVIECLLSRIMHLLRKLFPPEVTGVVLTMVGLNIVPIMMLDFFGLDNANEPIIQNNILVAITTLGVMIGTNIWGRGKLRLYSVIIGMTAGYLAAILLGVFDSQAMHQVAAAPFFAIPDLTHVRWSFDIRLLIPFAVVTLATATKSVATLTMCQKINDANWTRPDMDNIARGTLADGLASITGGLLGALGKSLYASSVGLSVATGVTSRVIAYYLGGFSIALAFLPKIAACFSVMPAPVMGGALVFMVCFMVVSGIQILTSRMIDIRKTFVIAVSLIFGVSVDIFPELYRHVHPFLHPLFSSSLSVTTVMAIGLNLILRIGVSRKAELDLAPNDAAAGKIADFLATQGAAWGARPDIMRKAEYALREFTELAAQTPGAGAPRRIEAVFDEFNLDVRIEYTGTPVELPVARPDASSLLAQPHAMARLSGFLIRHYADRVRVEQHDATCRVLLHFNH